MPTYKPFTTIDALPTNANGERTILEEHLDRSHETLADVLERIGQALFTAGGVVIAGTVTNPSDAIVRVQGRMGVSKDAKTFLAVGDQSVDLADVETDTKCLVVIRAESGAATSYNFTDPTTGESITHPLMTAWGRLAVLEGDDSDYPALPDDCVPVAQVTKTGAATLTIDTTITTAPTPRYSGGGGTPGGSDTQLQYNSSGSFAGIPGAVYDATKKSVQLARTLDTSIAPSYDDHAVLRATLTKDAGGENDPQHVSAIAAYVWQHASAGEGNVHGVSSRVVFKQDDAVGEANEATSYYANLIGLGTGSLWGGDINVQGPSASQADLMIGWSVNLVRRHSGATTDGAIGLNVTATRDGQTASATEPDGSAPLTGTTYPGDYGILVNGVTGDDDGGAATRAYTVGIGIGQEGGGWNRGRAGLVGTAIEATNYDVAGLSLVKTSAVPDIHIEGVRPEIRMQAAGQNTQFGRIRQDANSATMYTSVNAYFDGSNWQRDLTSDPSALTLVDGTVGYQFRRAAAGVGAITWTTPFKITTAKSVVVGDAALATNATDGFLYIPSMAGNPSGTPTAQTGTAAMVLDTTNNRLYVRSGANWRYAALT